MWSSSSTPTASISFSRWLCVSIAKYLVVWLSTKPKNTSVYVSYSYSTATASARTLLFAFSNSFEMLYKHQVFLLKRLTWNLGRFKVVYPINTQTRETGNIISDHLHVCVDTRINVFADRGLYFWPVSKFLLTAVWQILSQLKINPMSLWLPLAWVEITLWIYCENMFWIMIRDRPTSRIRLKIHCWSFESSSF